MDLDPTEEIDILGDSPTRITTRSLIMDFFAVMNLERGFLYTIKGLVLKPYATIQEYLYKFRRKHANPLRLLIFSSAIAALITASFTDFSHAIIEIDGQEVSTSDIGVVPDDDPKMIKIKELQEKLLKEFKQIFDQNLNIFYLSSVPILALLTFLFFRKKGYNFAEHFVIAAFLASMINIFSIVITPLTYFSPTVNGVTLFCSIGYTFFFLMTVFRARSFGGFVRALCVNILSYIFILLIAAAYIVLWMRANWEELGLDALESAN
ncbi:MAG: DUF3667 domain-containing protein [Flavobacteriales bacterium]|nr:DUF3667 domain-containing protein [Flavobacteriales bacterium]